MDLPETPLNVIYVKPKIKMTEAESKRLLTNFIALFAQIGFRELALNENSPIFADEYCK